MKIEIDEDYIDYINQISRLTDKTPSFVVGAALWTMVQIAKFSPEERSTFNSLLEKYDK